MHATFGSCESGIVICDFNYIYNFFQIHTIVKELVFLTNQ